jgi:hypothetical protein
MPRNGSGIYTVPATVNPVVPGTDITADWANSTLADLAQGVTDSLDRQGRGGMLAAFKIADGTVGAPGVAFTNETTTGFYRVSAAKVGFAVTGTNLVTYEPDKVTYSGSVFVEDNLLAGGQATFRNELGVGLEAPGGGVVWRTSDGVCELTANAYFAVAGGFRQATAGSTSAAVYEMATTAGDSTHYWYRLMGGTGVGTLFAGAGSGVSMYHDGAGLHLNAGAFTAPSDYRLKTNVAPLQDARALLDKLNPVTFHWKDNRISGPVMGFLAHEVQAVCPQAVVGEKDGEQFQSMDSSQLIPILVAALQDAHARIKRLEALH